MIDNLIVHNAIDDATNEITIVTEAVRFDNNLASYFQIVSTTLAWWQRLGYELIS